MVVRSREPGQQPVRKTSLVTFDGYAILKQISVMDNGLLEKIEETRAISCLTLAFFCIKMVSIEIVEIPGPK